MRMPVSLPSYRPECGSVPSAHSRLLLVPGNGSPPSPRFPEPSGSRSSSCGVPSASSRSRSRCDPEECPSVALPFRDSSMCQTSSPQPSRPMSKPVRCRFSIRKYSPEPPGQSSGPPGLLRSCTAYGLVSACGSDSSSFWPVRSVGVIQPIDHLHHALMCAGASPFSEPGTLLVQLPLPIRHQWPTPLELPSVSYRSGSPILCPNS